ncbi:MAG TPA: hypothetical protein VFA76_10810 [Terriglobales bacterium]|nr:hypothetical protein [Terriglobales bacterium]
MNSHSAVSRMVSLLLSVVVVTLTLAIVVPGIHAYTTVANAAVLTYNLAPNTDSAAITPATSRPVLVMGVCNTSGVRGVGQVSMIHVPASFLEWTGLESTLKSTITQGFSGVAGTHILYIDFGHVVDIRVASPDTFVVHNGAGGNRDGNVTLIW